MGSIRPIPTKVTYQSAASARPNCVGPDTKPPGRISDASTSRRAIAYPSPTSVHRFPAPGKLSAAIAVIASAVTAFVCIDATVLAVSMCSRVAVRRRLVPRAIVGT